MIIHECEQGSEDWLMLRSGMPTASNFSKLITSTGAPSKSMDSYAALLAAELYAEQPINDFAGNGWTERGQDLEDDGAAKYEFLNDCTLERVGFVTDDNKQYGCSPDRLVGDDGMIEIKCLKTENHVKTILDYRRTGKTPTTYIQQTQGQMYICRRKWCDLVFYHPVLPMLVIRQTPDKKVIDGLTAQLHAVRTKRDEILKTLIEY